MSAKAEPLLRVQNLSVIFKNRRIRTVAVDDVSFEVYRGESFGIVGESGSGKTTVARTIMRIYEPTHGTITFEGNRINGKISAELDKHLTKEIQMIFQDPMASLNERAKVDYIVGEGLINQKRLNKKELSAAVERALLDVGLLPEFASRFPHEFSGGQRQRIGIARALIMEPSFIIADEPISALDVSIRAQVLNLMTKLRREKNLTYLFIAHDLSVMRHITDRIAVMHKGRIVELCPTEELFKNPLHPYTQALISAVPLPDPRYEKTKIVTSYDPSVHRYTPQDPPILLEVSKGHYVSASRAELKSYKEQVSK